jgi:hypothetical protein
MKLNIDVSTFEIKLNEVKHQGLDITEIVQNNFIN